MREEHSVGTLSNGPFQGDGARAQLRCQVGPWEVDAGANTISGATGTVQVEPKVMQLLLVLLQRPGETLSIDYLLEVVWEDTIVEENALRRAISRLRKAFDDDPQQPQVIQTIPKRGYRLIAPVAPVAHEQKPVTAVSPIPLTKAATGFLPDVQARLQGWIVPVLIVPVLIIVVLIGAVVLVDQRRSSPVVEPLTNVPVTSLPGLETEAALSSDGSTIAFVWSGDTGDAPKIYIKDLEADAPRRLTDEPGTEHSPAWSPDGQWVAYLRRDEQGCGLYVAPVAGDGVRRLRTCGARTARGLTWSSDGAWIAYAEAEAPGEPVRLFLLSPETLKRRTLTAPANGQRDTDPVFAPGGGQLSFVRHEASGREGLYIVPVTGGEPEQVLFDFGNLAEHDWTPDGQSLVFSSNQGGNYRLWQVALAGEGAPRWLAEVGAYDPSSPSLARQGAQLAYVEWFFDFNIWQHSTTPDRTEPTRRIASSKWDLHPQYAPDGQRIAFTSNRSGTSELWVAEEDGTKPVRLTDFGGAFVSTPRWSPDGQYIAFEVRPAAVSDIYIIQAEGGMPRQLTDSTASDVAPRWSADGRWIYAGSTRSGRWEVWKIPVASGEAQPVTEAGGFAAFEAPDGRAVYYTKADTAGVWRRSLEGGPEQQVMSALATGDWGNWALHRTGIYFVRRTRAGDQVAFFDFASEAIRTIAPVGAPVAWNKAGLSLSPDGTGLLVTHTDHYESDIRLVPSFH